MKRREGLKGEGVVIYLEVYLVGIFLVKFFIRLVRVDGKWGCLGLVWKGGGCGWCFLALIFGLG